MRQYPNTLALLCLCACSGDECSSMFLLFVNTFLSSGGICLMSPMVDLQPTGVCVWSRTKQYDDTWRMKLNRTKCFTMTQASFVMRIAIHPFRFNFTFLNFIRICLSRKPKQSHIMFMYAPIRASPSRTARQSTLCHGAVLDRNWRT